jgi:hypothetical protein
MKHQFWIIDTDATGMSQGEFSASGPYPTQRAAEDHIRRETKDIWEDSCACLQSDKTNKWCNPLHIVKVIRTVQPVIRATVKLEEVEP